MNTSLTSQCMACWLIFNALLLYMFMLTVSMCIIYDFVYGLQPLFSSRHRNLVGLKYDKWSLVEY